MHYLAENFYILTEFYSLKGTFIAARDRNKLLQNYILKNLFNAFNFEKWLPSSIKVKKKEKMTRLVSIHIIFCFGSLNY